MPADYGLGSWPARRARISPDRVAFRQGDRALTFRELADRVERLADSLAALGVRRGDRVAYLGPNDIATFEVLFATGRLGAVFAPLNARLTAAELDGLLADASPSLLTFAPELAPTVAQLQFAGRTAGLRTDGGAVLAGAPHREPDGGQTLLDDDAVILFTSGTTGRAKGAVLTHGNLTFNTMNQLAHADVLSNDVALCISPLFHATGLGQVSLPTLFKGGAVVVVPKFEAGEVLALVEQHGIASFSCVPTMLQLLCDHPSFADADLSSLRFVIYGGSMVNERVAVAWQRRGVPLLQGYGMTEAAPGVTMAVADGAGQRPLSIGVPHFFTDVRLEGDGSRGELQVRGLNVFRGYWDRPEDTARAFDGEWYRSGDVVRTDDDGWSYVVDRVKDMIISGGENIYPAEVERAIDALPGVAASAVVGVPDERWGEVGHAYLVAADRDWDAQQLASALAGSLATFKIPKHVTVVPELPRTATGKVRKERLRSAHSGTAHTGQASGNACSE